MHVFDLAIMDEETFGDMQQFSFDYNLKWTKWIEQFLMTRTIVSMNFEFQLFTYQRIILFSTLDFAWIFLLIKKS